MVYYCRTYYKAVNSQAKGLFFVSEKTNKKNITIVLMDTRHQWGAAVRERETLGEFPRRLITSWFRWIFPLS